MNKLLLLFFLFFFVACSSEKSFDLYKQNVSKKSVHKTQVTSDSVDSTQSVEVNPSEAPRNSILTATLKGITPDEAKIEWLVNGHPVPPQESDDRFKATEVLKGDEVQAKAVIEGKEIISNSVTIINAPPELSKVKIMPEVFKPDDKLYIDAVGSDIDGDNVSIIYEWTVNGQPAGSGREIDAQIKKGDKISVKLTPYDGEAYGDSITLKREIKNLPPVIIQNNEFTFDGKRYTYQVKASDPDGDDLAYTLKEYPEGMIIDPESGMITWEVPAGDKINQSVKVLVSDNNGGELIVPFRINIGSAEKTK